MTFSELSSCRQGSLVLVTGTRKGYVIYWYSVVLVPFFLSETDLHTRQDLPRLDLQVDHGTDFAAWKAQ